MDFRLWQSRANLKPLPPLMERLRHQNIDRSTPPQQNAKNSCHHQGRNFSFKPPSTAGPLPPSENHVLHNQSYCSQLSMCKFYRSYSQEHTAQMFLRNVPDMPYIKRTPGIWDLVPFGCTLLTLRIPWQLLISAGSSQTTTSDVYDSVLHVGISRNQPALKMPKTIV